MAVKTVTVDNSAFRNWFRVLQKIFLKVKYVNCYREQRFISIWRLKCCSRWTEELLLCLVKTLNKGTNAFSRPSISLTHIQMICKRQSCRDLRICIVGIFSRLQGGKLYSSTFYKKGHVTVRAKFKCHCGNDWVFKDAVILGNNGTHE